MDNEKLRKTMLWFAMLFVFVFIVGLYFRNDKLQQTGPRTDFSGEYSNWKTETYDNGKIKAQGPIKDGYIKIGEWTYYREDGSIEGKEVYDNGRLVPQTDSTKNNDETKR